MTGIYIIKNLVNGKVYIGQSKNVRKRLQYHKRHLRRGTHYNAHLQWAFRKYREKAFWFGPLCECSEDELDAKERGWIEWYQSTDGKHGYNLETGGHANKTICEETRRKLSEALKGIIRGPLSDERRRQISEVNKNRTHSDETRRKMSEAQKIRPPISDETRHKLSEAGKNISDETRRKLSEYAKNRPDETLQKMSEARRGKTLSNATRQKKSESMKLYYARKKSLSMEIES